ncbi:MAG: alpha/beta fold hydrolase, partial [Chloroflexi bacterium]|nr:alpha/beta fold hydrolase [Chloroflexota bacterium]
MIVRPLATAKWAGCDTPASRFGWSYEAINYDLADDARLAAENPDPAKCRSQGTVAGSEVVTSDGVPIAGWYIPSARRLGPTGPTVIVVHGWKSNKSEALKYAVPFHDAYNLVLVDLRNGGRSGAADTTWGLHEQRDVRAMIDWVERTKHPSWIAAMGNSMGGATVLAEAVTDPRVRALIADSMHASALVSIGDGAEVENGLPSLPTSWAVVVGVAIRLGADWTVVDPVQTIA